MWHDWAFGDEDWRLKTSRGVSLTVVPCPEHSVRRFCHGDSRRVPRRRAAEQDARRPSRDARLCDVGSQVLAVDVPLKALGAPGPAPALAAAVQAGRTGVAPMLAAPRHLNARSAVVRPVLAPRTPARKSQPFRTSSGHEGLLALPVGCASRVGRTGPVEASEPGGCVVIEGTRRYIAAAELRHGEAWAVKERIPQAYLEGWPGYLTIGQP
jgi:hypothetical protein